MAIPAPSKDQIYEELDAIVDPIIQFKEDQPEMTEGLIQQVLAASKQLILLSESMEHRLEIVQTGSGREKVA